MAFMSPKSCDEMVSAAEAVISTISVSNALEQLNHDGTEFVDLRVLRELEKTGVIPDAHSCPRGLLEFWLDQSSPYARELFASEATFIFYCDNGWRSTLATRLAMEMGLQDVHCLKGGLDGWLTQNGPVVPYHW